MSDNNRNRNSSGNRGRKNNGGRSQKRSNKRRKKGNAKAARDFWGDPSKLPDEQPKVGVTTDPVSIPASLGQPPLTGQEANAQHYFEAVYTRAVFMAGALAADSNLVEEPDE